MVCECQTNAQELIATRYRMRRTLNEGYSYRHVLGSDSMNCTALSYLASHFDHSSKAEWQERLAAGEVLLNDVVATGFESLRAGGVLIWNRPGWLENETPQHYSLLYEDDQLLAVDKPSGLPTLPGAGYYLNTLLSLVRKDFPEACPLHRLGRATSGLVLLARDSVTASVISRDWPKIEKQYQALGSWIASQAMYDIRSPIGKLEHPRLGAVYAASPEGKPARSVARPLELRSNATLFEVDLHTGRPHQIRIHLAFIGHPLVGDPLYTTGGQPISDQPGLPGDAGYWLHAKRLKLTHPTTGKELLLNAPLPAVLEMGSSC